MSEKDQLSMSEKYALTINEASKYFNIGTKRMRRLAEGHLGTFSAYSGNRYLILRPKFEEYLLKNPVIENEDMERERELELKRAELQEKDTFNPEETILFYQLSRRKFTRFLEENEDLPFIAYFRERKLIIRSEFENYMRMNPEIKEGLKNARTFVSETT